jgi:hypothetical protein
VNSVPWQGPRGLKPPRSRPGLRPPSRCRPVGAFARRWSIAFVAFRVHDDYRSIETDANTMTEELHRLANASFSDRQAIELYTASADDETAGGVTSEQIATVYEEAGLLFPQAVSQRLEDVAAFHDAVMANRREYLASEVTRLEARLQMREQRIAGSTPSARSVSRYCRRTARWKSSRRCRSCSAICGLSSRMSKAISAAFGRSPRPRDATKRTRGCWRRVPRSATRSCATSVIGRSGSSTTTRRRCTSHRGVS